MMRRVLPAVLMSIAAPLAYGAPPIDFNREIKPILSNKCFHCHGPDEAERKGDLRLDTSEGAIGKEPSHGAIVPGKPELSPLLERVKSTDPDVVMPPPTMGKPLTAHEIDLLTRWIAEGGGYSAHWAYAPLKRAEPPAVKNSAWGRNFVDHWLLARMEQEGVSPQPEADRATLIRRLTLDLTGLPPTVAEVEAFLADQDQAAYDKVVDRLLNSTAYGEHWAHQWLDLARYADSAGYADDPARTIWLYRDYVIRAFNRNVPFDQFTIEQIAGDLLPEPSADQLIATAFHRNTLTNNEGGTNDEEFRTVAVVDRVNTTMAVWMGTTAACAQCHHHKYDPISQEEYFQLYDFFNQSEDADRGDEAPLYSQYQPEQLQQRQQWEAEIAALNIVLGTITPELKAAQEQWESQFATELAWKRLVPSELKRSSMKPIELRDGDRVFLPEAAPKDTTELVAPLPAGELRALRIETVPDTALPGGGVGWGGGNFVLSAVRGELIPPNDAQLQGRFVRVSLAGNEKILSLAEVEVLRGGANIAKGKPATQHSTDYGGDAARAVDGVTNGDYAANSVTHSAITTDPWWEVDLGEVQPVDQIRVWNRTDGKVGTRLKGAVVALLDSDRKVVWESALAEAPATSQELSPSGRRELVIVTAVADYAQPSFPAADVVNNRKLSDKGWAVGGSMTVPHAMTFVLKSPVEVPEGARLQLTLKQEYKLENHLLASFRVSTTSDPRAAAWGALSSDLLAVARKRAGDRSAEEQQRLTAYYLEMAPLLEPQRQERNRIQQQLAGQKPITVPVMKERAADQQRVTQVQLRGNFLDLGAQVTAGVPQVFAPLPEGSPRNRLGLAKWLIAADNPLTARVIANRYWESIFGVGIVATSEEFGAQGDLPFHPELLDALAIELQHDWNMKSFLRLLVTSSAYRQSSTVLPEMAQRDPENRLIARGPRFRLSAEMVRDQALAVSGLLSRKMFGPPVKPPQPASGLSAAFGSGIDWQTSGGEDKYRRGLYTTWRRSNPYPSMATFDAPNREVCTLRRVRTNTPLQALVTLNDPVFLEAGQALGRWAIANGGATVRDRLMAAFRRCTSRLPTTAELDRLESLHAQSVEELRQVPEEARKLAVDPLGPLPEEADVIDHAAWSVVANVLLNLDEMLMKR